MPLPPPHKAYLLETKARLAYFSKHKEKVLSGGEFHTAKSTRWNLKGVRRINWSAKAKPSMTGNMNPRKLVENWESFYQFIGSTVTFKYINKRGKIRPIKFSVHDPKYHKNSKKISFLVDSGFDFPWKGSFKNIQKNDLIDPIINFSSTRWIPKGWMDPDFPENYVGGAVKDYRGVDFQDADLSWADFSYADLRGANLKNTNLWYADFQGAKLKKTKLKGAYWFRTTCKDGTHNTLGDIVRRDSLSFSPCTKSQMSTDADLTDAYLRGANLTNMYLTDADLTDATYNPATTWPTAEWWDNTTCPDGSNSNSNPSCGF